MEDHKCDKEAAITGLQKEIDKLYKVIHGNGQPGIFQIMTELSVHVKAITECMPEFQEKLTILTAEKDGNDAIKKNSWSVLQKISAYVAIFGILATFYFTVLKKDNGVTAQQIQTVVRQELKNYNITDDEIILSGRQIKPEKMTPEKLQKEIKSQNK